MNEHDRIEYQAQQRREKFDKWMAEQGLTPEQRAVILEHVEAEATHAYDEAAFMAAYSASMPD